MNAMVAKQQSHSLDDKQSCISNKSPCLPVQTASKKSSGQKGLLNAMRTLTALNMCTRLVAIYTAVIRWKLLSDSASAHAKDSPHDSQDTGQTRLRIGSGGTNEMSPRPRQVMGTVTSTCWQRIRAPLGPKTTAPPLPYSICVRKLTKSHASRLHM
jgi:hypothetical protein